MGARAPQPTVTLKPQWNLLRQWLRKAPRARVTGRGGIFFSSTAPTHQLLSTTPAAGDAGWVRYPAPAPYLPRIPQHLRVWSPSSSPLNTMLACGRVRW